jgi:hypothetical protein
MLAAEDGGELFVEEIAIERGVGRPLAPAGGKELFLGSGMRCGAWAGKDGCGGADESGNAAVIGDAIDKPEMPDVGVRRLGLTADAVPA